MSNGISDRYGNLDFSSAIGFFPTEHKEKPPGPDSDPLQKQTSTDGEGVKVPYKQTTLPPEMNKPDGKFMVRLSKYGHLLLMGDQGYYWQKTRESADQAGEFYGDVEKDEEWETARWKYLQKLINEDSPQDVDQRRMMMWSRYGHKLEMRDVGWNKTRDGEYGDPRYISEDDKDQRWIKLRSKGGMLFQMSDMGFDPVEDVFVKRKLIEETGTKTEKENEYWKGDARWMRLITRHGYKIALDDRDTDKKKSDTEENPQGYGILIKGRRSPSSQGTVSEGDPKGFYWEFNEHDQVNQTTWGSPLGTTVQINDKLQYFMVGGGYRWYPKPWMGIKGNEFLEDPVVSGDSESRSYHLKLDLHNEYLSLKTAGGNGSGPWGPVVNQIARQGIQQGLECRDGSLGDDPWTELVDLDDRGLWFSGKEKLVVCRARQGTNTGDAIKICWWFDEKKREVVIKNSEDNSKIQIACNGDVEIIAGGDVNISSRQNINIRSSSKVILMGGSGKLEVSSGGIKINKVLYWYGWAPPVGIQSPSIPEVSDTPQLKPTNRGTRYNQNLEANKDITG
jgi:hypothetical protein